MQFHRTFSGAPWESKVGYCRAIRAGDHIYVTGTAPVDDEGGVLAPPVMPMPKQDVALKSSNGHCRTWGLTSPVSCERACS
jgi:hypothetical protein